MLQRAPLSVTVGGMEQGRRKFHNLQCVVGRHMLICSVDHDLGAPVFDKTSQFFHYADWFHRHHDRIGAQDRIEVDDELDSSAYSFHELAALLVSVDVVTV